jgi:uncharacterized protein YidB (DUF937 family)
MGILDDLMKNAGGGDLGALASVAASNPQLLQAALSLLSANDTSVGGSGGLGGLIQAFQKQGMGDAVASWIGGGPNQQVTPTQVASALGPDTLNEFAAKAGIGTGEASGALAGLLPMLVNQVTPQGQAPQGPELEGALGSLLSGFLR